MYDNETDRRLPLRPDGYFELHRPDSVDALFVEIDMGTETNDRVARKIRAYESYRRRGFETDYGWQVLDVLVITSGVRRMENLIRVTKRGTMVGLASSQLWRRFIQGRYFPDGGTVMARR